MRVHRLLVDSSKRLSVPGAHMFDFTCDISRLTTNQDFINDSHMVTVETCTPVSYSEFDVAFRSDSRHPPSLVLAWDKPVSNILGQPNALCHLQQFESKGIYGVFADSQHVSRHTMGVPLQGDTLNRSGYIRFQMLQETPTGFAPCKALLANTVYGAHYRFMLLFWTYPKPEKPLSHSFYRLFLSTRDRISGTVDDCHVPVTGIATNTNPVVDSWMVVLESISILKSSSTRSSLVLRSDTFRTSSGYDDKVLAVLLRTKVDYKALYGQRLSLKQATRDTIGIPVSASIDALRSVHLQMHTFDKAVPNELDNYTAVFVLFRAS